MKVRTVVMLMTTLGLGSIYLLQGQAVSARLEVEGEPETQQNRMEERTQIRLEQQDERLASRAAGLQEQCQAKVEKVSSRLRAFSANHNQRVGHFNLIATSLSKAEMRLSSAGADTTKLKGYIASLTKQITAVETNVTTYEQQLKTLSSTLCTGSVTVNRDKLVVANKQLEAIKQERRAIANYIKTVIRPEIVTLRKQLKPSPQVETETE